ncbi:MAG: hypothetical protein RIR76_894 [Verrucomicrobiota bacterium]
MAFQDRWNEGWPIIDHVAAQRIRRGAGRGDGMRGSRKRRLNRKNAASLFGRTMSSDALQLRIAERELALATAAGTELWRYCFRPDTPADESRRPYFHPVRSLAGDALTNFRPNDHAWHHGLSLTLGSAGGVNFWGGPSYRPADGYRLRGDHGAQVHRGWGALEAGRIEEELEWVKVASGRVLLTERRTLETALIEGGWSMRWRSELVNATGAELALGNFHASQGLAGSHYTGLQFRGARDLLDQHGDPMVGMRGEGGREGEAAVHGVPESRLDWHCQHDGSLRRTRIRFESLIGPIPWFVRAGNPLVAFAFHREQPRCLAAGETLLLDHRLSFVAG